MALPTNPPECSHWAWSRNGREGCTGMPHDVITQKVYCCVSYPNEYHDSSVIIIVMENCLDKEGCKILIGCLFWQLHCRTQYQWWILREVQCVYIQHRHKLQPWKWQHMKKWEGGRCKMYCPQTRNKILTWKDLSGAGYVSVIGRGMSYKVKAYTYCNRFFRTLFWAFVVNILES